MVTTLLFQPSSTAAYLLLMAAIASLWVSARPIFWLGLLTSAILSAFAADRMTVLGIVETVLFGFICFAFYRLPSKLPLKLISGLFLFLLSILLSSHRLPGFKNWLILSNFTFSPGSFPSQLYLNFDKPLIGLFIVAFGLTPARTLKEWKALSKVALPITLFTSLVLLGFSFALGYVRIDLKWFEFSWIWLLVNLFFTCIAEEALFRGFLQNQLSRLLSRWTYGSIISLILTSVLFGLVHFPGGWNYVFLATVAGLFYGYAYLKTQKIEASIWVHFFVNAIHFLVFTYPALKVQGAV